MILPAAPEPNRKPCLLPSLSRQGFSLGGTEKRLPSKPKNRSLSLQVTTGNIQFSEQKH